MTDLATLSTRYGDTRTLAIYDRVRTACCEPSSTEIDLDEHAAAITETILKRKIGTGAIALASLRRKIADAPTMVGMTDDQRRVLAVSRPLADDLGYDPEEMVGMSTIDLNVIPERGPTRLAFIDKHGGRGAHIGELRRRDGSILRLVLYVRSFEIAGKRVYYAIGRVLTLGAIAVPFLTAVPCDGVDGCHGPHHHRRHALVSPYTQHPFDSPLEVLAAANARNN